MLFYKIDGSRDIKGQIKTTITKEIVNKLDNPISVCIHPPIDGSLKFESSKFVHIRSSLIFKYHYLT